MSVFLIFVFQFTLTIGWNTAEGFFRTLTDYTSRGSVGEREGSVSRKRRMETYQVLNLVASPDICRHFWTGTVWNLIPPRLLKPQESPLDSIQFFMSQEISCLTSLFLCVQPFFFFFIFQMDYIELMYCAVTLPGPTTEHSTGSLKRRMRNMLPICSPVCLMSEKHNVQLKMFQS